MGGDIRRIRYLQNLYRLHYESLFKSGTISFKKNLVSNFLVAVRMSATIEINAAKQNNAFSIGQSCVTLENVFDWNVALNRALILREYGSRSENHDGDGSDRRL